MSRFNGRLGGVIAILFVANGCTSLPLQQGRSNVDALVQSRAAAGIAIASLPDAQLTTWLAAPLTLEQAQQIALLRNPALRSHYARLGLSAADVFEAGRLQNPSLSLSWLLPMGAAEGGKVGASLMSSFADLLLRHARQRIAAAEFAGLQEQVASATLDVLADAQRAWFDCVAANQRVAVRRSIADAAGVAADLARQYNVAGNISALELQMQRAEASQARIALHEAQMAQADARARMQQVLGLSASQSSWTVPEAMPELPSTPPPATASLVARVLDQRLDISAARRHVSALEQQRDATRRHRMLADSRAGVAFDREADGARRLGPSVELALPLFHQGQGAVARAEAGLEAARAARDELEIAAQAELTRHLSRLALAREQAQAYRDGLIPAREAVVARLTERANFMLVDTFAVLLARQQEYAAYAGYVDAQLNFWNAQVNVLQALGSQRALEEPR